jgi:hypothetical protein
MSTNGPLFGPANTLYEKATLAAPRRPCSRRSQPALLVPTGEGLAHDSLEGVIAHFDTMLRSPTSEV